MNEFGLALVDFAIEHPFLTFLLGLIVLIIYIYILILEVKYG